MNISYSNATLQLDSITGHSPFQNQWNKDTHACGRPAPDLGLTFACSLYDGQPQSADPGFAFNAYKKCCPVDDRINIWIAEEGCGVYCYTSDLKLAYDFNECAVDIGKGVGNNSNMTGRCGRIDYVALKKGVSAGANEKGVGILGVMVGSLILTAAVMVL